MNGTARRGHPYHHIAAACGIPALGPSLCALCGPSPFAAAGFTRDVLGVGWSDWHLMADRSGREFCAGCCRLTKGKPGSEPAPLRSRSFCVRSGVYRQLDRATFYETLCTPPEDLEVLSWATTGQRHHHLHAGWCDAVRLRVGSDDASIQVDVLAVQSLVEALSVLRAGPKAKAVCTRDEILTGRYRPATIAALGAARWRAAESAIVSWRGSPVLRLYVEHTPVVDVPIFTREDAVIDPVDQQIVELLSALSLQSRRRQSDPIRFWGSLFLRRVQRHAHRDLPQFLSRMMQDLEVEPSGAAARAVTHTITTVDAQSAQEFMQHVADRAPVLVALTYDARQTRKEQHS